MNAIVPSDSPFRLRPLPTLATGASPLVAAFVLRRAVILRPRQELVLPTL